MDEQMTTAQPQETTNIDTQQDFSSEPAPENYETSQGDFSQSDDNGTNSDISFNEDGDVNFSDEYLAEQEKHFFGERTENPQDTGNFDSQSAQQPPSFYTDEELANTPFEQWDINRLNGDIKKFVPIVQQQFARRNIQNQVNQRAQQVPQFLQNQPQQYSYKELNEAAHKLACERLGLEDAEDFDEYEGEHRAALDLARQELMSTRQREMAEYGRRAADWQQLQNFNRELAARPDFQEFNNWYVNRLREVNVTPEQVNNYLMNKAISNGYNFSLIPQEVAGWYREFLQTKTQRQKSPMPPKLENTRGGNAYGSSSMNMRNFGDMDLDAQAQALMRMGVV